MKSKFSALIVTISLVLMAHEIFGQNKDFFEGVLHNSFVLLDSTGNKKSFPWEELIEYYDRSHILQRVIEKVGSDFDIYLDSEEQAIYKIDHNQQTIKKLTIRKA